MEPVGLSPHLQELATCPCPEPDQFNPYLNPTASEFILILFSHLRQGLPSGILLSDIFATSTLICDLKNHTTDKYTVWVGHRYT